MSFLAEASRRLLIGGPAALLVALLAFSGIGGAAMAATAAEPTASNEAVTAASATSRTTDEFDPGFIISDYNFYNATAMSESDIQNFLEAQDCAPKDTASCLADYSETTADQPTDAPGHCVAYEGAPNESASRILAKVAEACQISPRVLLILLQKEQSLLTSPSESGYLRAAGYGCPDTADCNADYFGFFNQIYHAAWQFRQYTQEPDRAYKIGEINVGFHPNAACGATTVTIKNQATANLYNYTPYQPNAAALADITKGDACSADGNLNFWLMYNNWFGASDAKPFPDIFDPCLNLVGGRQCVLPTLLPSVPPRASAERVTTTAAEF
ncbi:hypothetical protein [Leifsonia sp. A12D58]|uniref:hypothetical protein n=1 Tax=Leifsonia sp. A12D58 TaxID=3397674 RepID=UPI0039DF7EEE